MPYLESLHGQRTQHHELDDDTIVIGRSLECRVILEGASISRKHAQITRVGTNFFVQDLESRRGTSLNGRPVKDATKLHEGDTITICDHSLVFHSKAPGEATQSSCDVQVMGDLETNTVIMSTLDASPGLVQPEANAEAKLRAVVEIARSFHRTLKVNDLLPKVLDSLFHIFPQAARGFILVEDEAKGELVPRAVKSRTESDEALAMSQTVINEALEKRQGILSADALSDDQFKHSQSISDLGIRSIMCVPLLSQGDRPIGVVQLHTEHGGRRFTASDLDVLVSVAITTAMALENASLHENQVAQERMQRELQLARDVQRRFLPASQPVVDSYSFFSHYDAAYSVGGDYYGFIDLPDEHLAISLGDVSGKGMAAAMMMARLSSDVRFSMISSTDPAEAMQSINLSLGEAEIEDKFITLLLMVLDRESHELSIANAGHLYPLLRRVDGSVEEIGADSAGFPLNVSPDPYYRYKVATLSMEPGSILVAYTDGVTETRNDAGDLYGLERLLEIVREAPPDTSAIGEAILEDVSRFGEESPQKDDLTLVLVGRDAG